METVPDLENAQLIDVAWLSAAIGEKVDTFVVDNKSVAPEGSYGVLGSMVGLTVKTSSNRKLNIVAKFHPIDKEWKDFIQMSGIDTKEAAFYKNALPTLTEIAEPHKIRISVPRCYAPIPCPLLLEDLRPLGYRMASIQKGYTDSEAKASMDTLASIHAVGMMCKEPIDSGASTEQFIEMHASLLTQIVDGTKFLQDKLSQIETGPNQPLTSYISTVLERKSQILDTVFQPSGPFTTIVHTDAWLNNCLFRYDADGSAIECILLDWQFWNPRGGLGADVALALLSGLTPEDYNSKATEYVKYYHSRLIEFLTKLGYDSDKMKLLSLESLLKHYDSYIEPALSFMLGPTEWWLSIPELSSRFMNAVEISRRVYAKTVEA